MSFVGNVLRKLTSPLSNLQERIMQELIKNVAKKALSSLVKGFGSALIVFLTAGLAALPTAQDKLTGALLVGFVALVHALISGIKRAMTFDVSKVVK